MKDATRLLAIVCALWCARSDGGKPSSGYCIGNQCFTASEQPETFVAAQKECEGLGGHLMTVRTSVSHDVLSLLLGNVSGRFWIGLHLPTACPDGSLELNGFSWVPGGSESDFSNWPAAFDGGCSSDRCVSVSPVDDFKWTREPCDARAAGFLCEFGFNVTCRGLGAGAGGTPTYSTPIGIEGGELLSLPPGSVAVLMPSGSKYICFSGGWVEAPWTCEVLGGGCEHRCTLDPEQMPLCYCPRGQTVNPENQVTCEEAQGDPCAALRCAHACYDNGGSHACKCRQGFKLAADGRSCVDVDECVSAPCEHECKNSPGSYKCACYSGYRVDAKEPHRCQLHCEERECAAECDPQRQVHLLLPGGLHPGGARPGKRVRGHGRVHLFPLPAPVRKHPRRLRVRVFPRISAGRRLRLRRDRGGAGGLRGLRRHRRTGGSGSHGAAVRAPSGGPRGDLPGRPGLYRAPGFSGLSGRLWKEEDGERGGSQSSGGRGAQSAAPDV
ncbi:unnamed protein product [Tetraodon nigroviridis]|uniref:(spotted green pufferfish) hypothetical protein n=1 Tax=Tetraodon nigroviridis TaxID=99883 RepID=Q4SWS2_TETNG|nr:unnamed protein product [Tetraodon nigroviridis]